jgi:CheY-like chemotaxis protein
MRTPSAKVLIVEDDFENCAVIARVLGGVGYTTVETDSAEHALETIKKKCPNSRPLMFQEASFMVPRERRSFAEVLFSWFGSFRMAIAR